VRLRWQNPPAMAALIDEDEQPYREAGRKPADRRHQGDEDQPQDGRVAKVYGTGSVGGKRKPVTLPALTDWLR
jgi:hypothetical protein